MALNSPAASIDDAETRKRIIAVARECFAKYGPRRTTMEDIAAAAGIARPALYRYVASREEIIEAVIIQRVEELADDFRSLIGASASFADAFVEVSMAAINSARLDPELQALFETTTGTRIIQVMAGANTVFHEFVKGFFKDAFAAARATGELRADVSDDALSDWYRGVIMMMILREDLDAERERAMVKDFLLRSIQPPPDRAVDRSETGDNVPPRPVKRRKAPAVRKARS